MQMQTATHASLLLRLRDDADGGAWNEFLDRYGELIRGFARRRGLQSADCDDIAQDVLLSLSKALPNFQYINPPSTGPEARLSEPSERSVPTINSTR